MKELLDSQLYDVDDFDSNGVTPLYISTRYRHSISSLELVKAGANSNVVCEEVISENPHRIANRTVLKEAIMTRACQEISEDRLYPVKDVLDAFGDSEIVDMLFCEGASMDNPDVYHTCQILIDTAKSDLIEYPDSKYLDMIKCLIKQIVLLES
ncbi:hypothetical protein QAD02_013872 [Eretmocerus hayati]|uniref:Uncharacterized protein n=1 Tax=Eretmocerus hayati TaxID=131215 RepID=A0ACC2P3C7_9HYME|nr:hypothetical protein QAD02_013872 [Eretmocerus hayati]